MNQICDNKDRILILNVTMQTTLSWLVCTTLTLKMEKLKFKHTFNYNENYWYKRKHKPFTNRRLQCIFDTNLECCRSNPSFKQKSVAKLIEIIETFNLCDIGRIRNPKMKKFTFRQQHRSGLMQRRQDYIFISNAFQESILNTEVLPPFVSVFGNSTARY